jgi:hypothetical protein
VIRFPLPLLFLLHQTCLGLTARTVPETASGSGTARPRRLFRLDSQRSFDGRVPGGYGDRRLTGKYRLKLQPRYYASRPGDRAATLSSTLTMPPLRGHSNTRCVVGVGCLKYEHSHVDGPFAKEQMHDPTAVLHSHDKAVF